MSVLSKNKSNNFLGNFKGLPPTFIFTSGFFKLPTTSTFVLAFNTPKTV